MNRYNSRGARFSNRVLLVHASAGLPQGLSIRAVAGKPTEILLYDEIGFWGITAKDFTAALRDVGSGPIHLRINSPGGEVFDGLAIYNALRQHPGEVTVSVDGIAASAASFIAMAGKSVSIAASAFMMIHNAQGLALGDRHDLEQLVAVMAKIDGQLAAIYAGRTGKPAEEMAGLMDAETWFTGQEAKDIGFADVVTDDPAPTAMAAIKPGAFEHAPAALIAAAEDPAPLLAEAQSLRRRLLRLAEAEA